MLIYNAELVDVEITENYKSLIFKTKRYDNRIKETVITSETVGISSECEHFISNYRKYIGEVIFVGVSAIKTKNNKIFYLTNTDVLNDSLNLIS